MLGQIAQTTDQSQKVRGLPTIWREMVEDKGHSLLSGFCRVGKNPDIAWPDQWQSILSSVARMGGDIPPNSTF